MANSPISFTHNGLFSIERGASRHQLTLLDLFGTNDLDSPEGRYFTLSYQPSYNLMMSRKSQVR